MISRQRNGHLHESEWRHNQHEDTLPISTLILLDLEIQPIGFLQESISKQSDACIDQCEQHKMYSGQPEVVVQNYIPSAVT